MSQPEEAPDWIIEQIEVDETGQRTKETIEKPLKEQSKVMGKVTPDDWNAVLQPGERNDGLTKRAGSLIGRGIAGNHA